MNFINNIKYKLIDYYDKKYLKKQFKKYPDYEDNEFNDGKWKFIWGITSYDDLSRHEACLHTMNDIDITYNRDNKKYYLSIETAYMFKDEKAECKYLRQLLDAFTNYMDNNNLNKNERYFLFFHNPEISLEAESIEQLYTHFKIFVDGYCTMYKYNE